MKISNSSHTLLDDEGEIIDDERESGDGQEEQESEGGSKKKVDHDEDRSNPQYIPKKGTFYEHDDRTVEDLDLIEQQENSENLNNSNEALSNSSKILSIQNQKVTPKQVKKTKDTDCWSHDRFNEMEQAPKSRNELVSAYGYDIRNEDCAPRPRRPRRYGRHQGKYSRNWEDEEAYKKTQAMQVKMPSRRPLQPEDFPALGSNKVSSKPRDRVRHSSRPQDENDPALSSNYRSPVRNREQRPRDERGSRELRSQRYNNDTSNNNNSRNVKGKKNINFNHNIEFKNQNRKNINYESTQPKNNNVHNQQMQSSTSTSQNGQSAQGGNQQQSGQRYNNEAPVSTMSFTNSKMNNTTNNSSAPPASGSSRTILNFDNSSGNYGRGSREKEVNSQHQHQMHQQQISNQGPSISPNKNLQYTDHQIDQMKLMEKNYQQQQGKTTNLNLNQVPQHQQQQPMNNMQEVQMMNNSEMTRSKRYSSLRQRSNLNDTQPQSVPYHQQYHQQEIDPALVQNVMPAQQAPAFIPQQTQQAPANMMAPQTVPQTTAQVPSVQQQPQTQKYQAAAYYAANPANEYAAQQAAMMNAMVEKYQYQQQPPAAQYLPPQQPQQIYIPQPQPQPPQQQQQILNYVSTIQPQAPAAAPAYPQYTNYQNYNIQAPAPTPAPAQPAPQQPQPTSQPIYQTQSGLTYYPNAQIAPAHPQRVIQPQRRPNPIPILAPPDHKKNQGNAASADDSDKNADNEKGTSSAENIDHILDNMFVQRQPYEPTISLKDPQSSVGNEDKSEEINEGMNVGLNNRNCS
jgi:protein CASC3